MMMTAVMLCVYAGCTPRKAAKSLEVFNHMLRGLLGANPCHTTIRTWLAKMGLDAIKERGRNPEEAYAVIMDVSISVGDQQMLLALKIPADHGEKALTHSDEEVVGMAVSENWPAKKVQEFCREIEEEQGRKADYYITDNGKNLKKAVEELQIPHHRDISHTLAVFLKHVYEKDEEFANFKNLVANTKHLALTKHAYLMPPKQRGMARFMNLYPIVDWAKKVLQNTGRMTKDERFYYGFVERNASLVEGLDEVMTTYSDIMKICKQQGLSKDTAAKCKAIMSQRLLCGSERMRKIEWMVREYLDRSAGCSPMNIPCTTYHRTS